MDQSYFTGPGTGVNYIEPIQPQNQQPGRMRTVIAVVVCRLQVDHERKLCD